MKFLFVVIIDSKEKYNFLLWLYNTKQQLGSNQSRCNFMVLLLLAWKRYNDVDDDDLKMDADTAIYAASLKRKRQARIPFEFHLSSFFLPVLSSHTHTNTHTHTQSKRNVGEYRRRNKHQQITIFAYHCAMTCRFLLACLHEEFDVGVGTYYLATLTTY